MKASSGRSAWRTGVSSQRVDWVSIALFLVLAIILASLWAEHAVERRLLQNPATAGLVAWVAELSVLVAALAIILLRSRNSLRNIGWHWAPFKAYLAVAAGTIAVVVCSWVAGMLLKGLVYSPHLRARQAVIALPLMLLFSCIFAFAEEFGWRGFLLVKLLPLGPVNALLISGLLWFLWEAPLVWFGILDAALIQVNAPLTLVLHFLSTISTAVILGYLRLRFNSVVLPTFAHGLLNAMGAVSFFYFMETRPFAGDFAGPIGTALTAIVAIALLLKAGSRLQTAAVR